MKYILSVFLPIILIACAGPTPEKEMELDDIPPPTIQEIEKPHIKKKDVALAPAKKLPKKKRAKK